MHYNKNRHAKYKLIYHLVVVTKYRHPVITKPIKKRLEEVAHQLFDRWNCSVLELNTDEDHLHILFEAPPQVQLSKLINNFKTVSSRYIRRDFADVLEKYYWKPYFWSNSYLVLSTGGATIEVIKEYIQNQDREG